VKAIALFESKIDSENDVAGNVDLVRSILTLTAFEELFPLANVNLYLSLLT